MKPEDFEFLLQREDSLLAPYASRSSRTRGRESEEPSHPYRTEFQRDRERIIHSRAFRRLEYKTQVFINHEGDHYRTRLTHSIEVAQISRTIARALRLNEDLAESIALAHDLGHTPFGHAGEKELNDILAEHGGFEHNRQSLRVVTVLEKSYARFDGLNLTWETREGIIKHSSEYDSPELSSYAPDERPTLEAQIIDIADEIAYNNHEIDDGLESGILSPGDLEELTLWKTARAMCLHTEETGKLLYRKIIRTIINILVSDIINNTLKNIETFSIETAMDVKKAGAAVAGFSGEIENAGQELKKFLRERLYQHHRVARMTIKARRVVRDLFSIYTEYPDTLPESYRQRIGPDGLRLTVTDYIAGMTDRFALEEHMKLTDPMIRV